MHEERANFTVQETIDGFLEHLKESGKTERTLYTYGKDLEIVASYFGAVKKLADVRLPQVGKFYKSDLLLKRGNGEPKAKRTLDKTIRVFRMLMIWAKDTGVIHELPLPKSTPMGRSVVDQEVAEVVQEPIETEAG